MVDKGGQIGKVESIDEERIQIKMNESVKTVYETSDYLPFGIDALPEKGAKAVLFNLGSKAFRLMLGIKRKVADRIAKPGETRLYSKTGSQVYLDENDDVIVQSAGVGHRGGSG